MKRHHIKKSQLNQVVEKFVGHSGGRMEQCLPAVVVVTRVLLPYKF